MKTSNKRVSSLAKDSDKLKKSASFYLSYSPRHFNPETKVNHLPEGLREHVEQLYAVRGEVMPSKENTPQLPYTPT